MTETESALAATPPAEKAAAGGAKKANEKPSGPSVADLIVQAVTASKKCSGVSLASRGHNVDKNNSRLKTAIKSLLTKGSLVEVKGTKDSGSFKINKKQHGAKDKAKASKTTKTAQKKKAPSAAKNPKKDAAANKATKSLNKPKAAAKPKKVTAAKSPAKKAAKPKTAAKSPAKKAAKPKRK